MNEQEPGKDYLVTCRDECDGQLMTHEVATELWNRRAGAEKEREVRRRMREWLEAERHQLAYRCAECVLAKLDDLERELSEEK